MGQGYQGHAFLNGTLSLHRELERELAEFLHKEDCTIFSTGYQTNLGIILRPLLDVMTLSFCDKENHASIYDGCRLSYAEMIRYNHK